MTCLTKKTCHNKHSPHSATSLTTPGEGFFLFFICLSRGDDTNVLCERGGNWCIYCFQVLTPMVQISLFIKKKTAKFFWVSSQYVEHRSLPSFFFFFFCVKYRQHNTYDFFFFFLGWESLRKKEYFFSKKYKKSTTLKGPYGHVFLLCDMPLRTA